MRLKARVKHRKRHFIFGERAYRFRRGATRSDWEVSTFLFGGGHGLNQDRQLYSVDRGPGALPLAIFGRDSVRILQDNVQDPADALMKELVPTKLLDLAMVRCGWS
jgi:hypothetical protein